MLAKALCQFFIRIVWMAIAQPEQQFLRLVRPRSVPGHITSACQPFCAAFRSSNRYWRAARKADRPTLRCRPRAVSDRHCSRFGASSRHFAHFLQYVVGGLEGIEASWNTAIDRGVQKYFLDVVHAQAVIDRATNMQLDLRRFAERGEHSQVDHATRLLIEPWTAPCIAPAPFSRYVLKRHHEFVRTLEGVVDIFCAEHFAAQFEATVKHAAHRFSVIFAHLLLHLVTGDV